MSTAAPERDRLGVDAAGLVVMLDVAGRTIGALEDRIALLEDALVAERRERSHVENMLDELRREAAHLPDTPDVDPPAASPAENVGYGRPPAKVP